MKNESIELKGKLQEELEKALIEYETMSHNSSLDGALDYLVSTLYFDECLDKKCTEKEFKELVSAYLKKRFFGSSSTRSVIPKGGVIEL